MAFANGEGETSGTNNWSKGGYLLGSYAVDKYVPYVKLDYLEVDEGDLFYDEGETKALALGGNYRISHLAVLKLQYTLESVKDADTRHELATQFSIGF